MSVTAGVGISYDPQAGRAGREAAQRAVAKLPLQQAQAAFVFASSRFEQPPLLEGIRSVLSAIPLVGGTTAGEITADGAQQRSVVVLALNQRPADGFCSVGSAPQVRNDPRLAGQTLARAVLEGGPRPRSGLLVWADGLSGISQDLIRGVQEVLGTSSRIVGGFAGDDLRFRQTHQYCNDTVLSDGCVGLLLGGSVKLGVAVRHGWIPIGKPRQVTRAERNLLISLDHRPARAVYEEYFGREAVEGLLAGALSRMTISYPLGILVEGEEEFLLRNVLQMNPDGSLVCAGEIPAGSWLRLMIGSKESALAAARRAAEEARAALRHVACVLVLSSVARRKLFGPDASEEIALIRRVFGEATPIAGGYTYGEQAPLRAGAHLGRSYIQNETILLIALGE